jgi:hypothetical protein
MRKFKFVVFFLLCCVGLSAQINTNDANYKVKSGEITLQLSESGDIIGLFFGKSQMNWIISGGTQLKGLHISGDGSVKSSKKDGSCIFTRTMEDSIGHKCVITDIFSPDKGSIRWDIEITSNDAPWSTSIITQMKCAKPEEKLIWTAWGSPDFSDTPVLPELQAILKEAKASVNKYWSDPLMPVAFLNRNWHYGNVTQSAPVINDYFAIPMITVLAPTHNAGMSLVLSPDDVMLYMDLSVTPNGDIQFNRLNHRLGENRTVKFSMNLVLHEASWRGGLRFMTQCYPQCFEAPNQRVHQIGGCGAYSISEAPIDVEKFKKMSFGFNWKLSDDFPYMGMFIPPVKNGNEKWKRSCDEKAPPDKDSLVSCRQLNDYAKYMKRNGFSVLSYFNVTEFGKNMYNRKAVLHSNDPELWKDPVAYLKYCLPNAVFDPGIQTCYYAYIVDPADPDYLKFILEQAERHIKLLPSTDGICIDRADWLKLFNTKADDGVSWVNDKPARSLFRSWIIMQKQLGPMMHNADKVIFSNLMALRLELGNELDGIYTEFGNNGNALNASALLGTRKPVVGWTVNETINEPNSDDFMQRHLHLGVFPTAPYPYNHHSINPEPTADKLYLDYGLLLNAMRGKKWVLEPNCVETTTKGVKVNMFEVPGGYALPVTFGGKAESAIVRVRNISGLDKMKVTVIHPGDDLEIPVVSTYKDGVLELNVSLKLGCGMVKLTTLKN